MCTAAGSDLGVESYIGFFHENILKNCKTFNKKQFCNTDTNN